VAFERGKSKMPVEGKQETAMRRRLRLGMVGGGPGAFIGGVHRIAARLDGHYELVAGAMASDPARAKAGGASLGIAPGRAYGTFEDMVEGEKTRSDRIDAVAIVAPNFAHYAAAKPFSKPAFTLSATNRSPPRLRPRLTSPRRSKEPG
jgi:hypothetical protein